MVNLTACRYPGCVGSVFCAHISQNHNKPSRRYSHSGLLWPLVMATSAQLGGAQTSQESLLDSQLKTDAFTPILYKEVLWNYRLRWVFVLFCCCFACVSFASVVLTQKPGKSYGDWVQFGLQFQSCGRTCNACLQRLCSFRRDPFPSVSETFPNNTNAQTLQSLGDISHSNHTCSQLKASQTLSQDPTMTLFQIKSYSKAF